MAAETIYTIPSLVAESQEFDYIIVGGGVAGLTLAARLSEDKDVTVAVLEAGEAKLNDQAIMTPAMFSTLIANPEYDWMMKTIPQNGLNGKIADFPRGKVLGGSSAINFMMYVRPQKADLDAWAKLGNEGWGWDDMLPYFLKTQSFQAPKTDGAQKLLKKVGFDAARHGHNGPMQTSFTPFEYPLESAWVDAAKTVVRQTGTAADTWGGKKDGVYHSLCTVDRSNNLGTRSYAVSGYYSPVASRPNLKVATQALVSKVLLDTTQAKPRACGVEVIHGGRKYIIQSKKEVILSAGVTRSSQLLELSGIGNPVVLKTAGVKTIVPNNFVGENLQDHIATGIVHEIADGEFSMDELQDPEILSKAVQRYGSLEGGPVSTAFATMGFISYADLAAPDEIDKLAKQIVENNRNLDKRFQVQRALQLQALKSKASGTYQLLHLPCNMNFDRGDDQRAFLSPHPSGSRRITLAICLQNPFSRGSSHILSADPEQHPAIDPAYLEDPADVKLLIKGLQLGEKICQTIPLKEKLKLQVQPPLDLDITDMDAAEKWLRNNAVTEYHPMGTASLGLVVDSRLRVLGVSDLRVCDGSVFPSAVTGNLQALIYAIAEKGAEMIKQDRVK